MESLEGRHYSEHHLWVQQEPQGLRIGITHWGCEFLGSIDHVELPAQGQLVTKDRPFGWVETSKAVTELISPVSGTVLATNDAVKESPGTITQDAYGKGWLILVSPSDLNELAALMTPDRYAALVNEGA
jgi:glycine cleavage system H protein